LVNINIHPRKENVRLKNEDIIAEIVTNSVRDALKSVGFVSTAHIKRSKAETAAD